MSTTPKSIRDRARVNIVLRTNADLIGMRPDFRNRDGDANFCDVDELVHEIRGIGRRRARRVEIFLRKGDYADLIFLKKLCFGDDFCFQFKAF